MQMAKALAYVTGDCDDTNCLLEDDQYEEVMTPTPAEDDEHDWQNDLLFAVDPVHDDRDFFLTENDKRMEDMKTKIKSSPAYADAMLDLLEIPLTPYFANILSAIKQGEDVEKLNNAHRSSNRGNKKMQARALTSLEGRTLVAREEEENAQKLAAKEARDVARKEKREKKDAAADNEPKGERTSGRKSRKRMPPPEPAAAPPPAESAAEYAPPVLIPATAELLESKRDTLLAGTIKKPKMFCTCSCMSKNWRKEGVMEACQNPQCPYGSFFHKSCLLTLLHDDELYADLEHTEQWLCPWCRSSM